jgi:aspartate-semialdehyde dehydrogenase
MQTQPGFRVAVIGATGLVGATMREVLLERNFPISEFLPVASARNVGRSLSFGDREWTVRSLEDACAAAPDFALFSAGGAVSTEWAPRFAAAGTVVIDNSSAWRLDPAVPLIVPEVNGSVLRPDHRLIANPNCTTAQLVVALAPLHAAFGVVRGVVSTYQSVTGTGAAAIAQLEAERQGLPPHPAVYPHPIDRNCIPHCDSFLDSGYTKEEMKVWHETKKILGDPDVAITCTAVRVPVLGGHSESVYLELARDFTPDAVRQLLEQAPGLTVVDDPQQARYPMPRDAAGKDTVFVGRIRPDLSHPRGLHLWIVADNLRKGAATNAVQIAEHMAALRS